MFILIEANIKVIFDNIIISKRDYIGKKYSVFSQTDGPLQTSSVFTHLHSTMFHTAFEMSDGSNLTLNILM